MKHVTLLLLLVSNVALASQGLVGETDSTDYSSSQRSKMVLYIDAATGCHYLSLGTSQISTLIPRMSTTGQHICGGLVEEQSLKLKRDTQRPYEEAGARRFRSLEDE